MATTAALISQLQRLEADFDALRNASEHDDLSGGATVDAISQFITGARAAISRIAGDRSAYMAEFATVRLSKG